MSNIKNLDNLKFDELKDLLKEVKLYRDLKKQLGNRGKVIYSNMKAGKKTFVVEYFSALGAENAWENASKVYSSVFNLDVNKNEVKFVELDSIKGGIKVYADDKVVDLSYQKIERIITK